MSISKKQIGRDYILDADSSLLAEMIHNREITSLLATQTYIARIQEINLAIFQLGTLLEENFRGYRRAEPAIE